MQEYNIFIFTIIFEKINKHIMPVTNVNIFNQWSTLSIVIGVPAHYKIHNDTF